MNVSQSNNTTFSVMSDTMIEPPRKWIVDRAPLSAQGGCRRELPSGNYHWKVSVCLRLLVKRRHLNAALVIEEELHPIAGSETVPDVRGEAFLLFGFQAESLIVFG